MDEEESKNSLPDRPLECTECKKPASIRYTEIIGKKVNRTSMCIDCPFLSKRLQGSTRGENPQESHDTLTGLCCGNCGTTLDTIRTGNPLGCTQCYEIFENVLIQEIIASKKIPQKLITAAASGTTALHQGYSPGESKEVGPSLRLLALNEALNETLTREDYEQAAWLRDQIKELTEQSQEKSDE